MRVPCRNRCAIVLPNYKMTDSLSHVLRDSDRVTRFLHHRSQLRDNGRRAHFAAFMPTQGGTSVADITGLDEDAVWKIGPCTLAPASGRTQIMGRADLMVRAAIGLGLRAVRDDAGFCRHAELRGWPEGDESKSRQQEIAKELANAARCHLPPTASI